MAFPYTRTSTNTSILHTHNHKPTPVGRPIISGCDGPTERISAFVDHLIQPIAQKQASYLKDTTDFLNFIEKTKLPKSTILVSMDVTSLYTNRLFTGVYFSVRSSRSRALRYGLPILHECQNYLGGGGGLGESEKNRIISPFPPRPQP